jgi:histone-lysine N-methyltransferase SETMAR
LKNILSLIFNDQCKASHPVVEDALNVLKSEVIPSHRNRLFNLVMRVKFATLDESWFSLNTDHELIWLQPGEEIPEIERRTIQSEKVMLMIVWNPSGFHMINVVPKWFKFNASFYVTQILGLLSDWCRTQVGRTNHKLWVHADNARPHTATVTLQFMQQNAMRRTLHPPYSPDLEPSDFYLFDYIKQLLLGCEFTDRDSFLQGVRDILGGIEKATLEGVFCNWMERLHQSIAIGGEYVE